jgi:uncharacterized protein
MRRPTDDNDAKVTTPFPTVPVSNGEWLPPPITAKQRTLQKLIAEEMTWRAKWHGMSRAQFLRTAAATVTAWACMNRVFGLDSSGGNAAMAMGKQQCDDLDAARELLDRKEWFVMDVQQHHADLEALGAAASSFCFLRFLREPNDPAACAEDPAIIGQDNYIKEVFVDSVTTVGVISGLPYGVPLGPEAMAATRDRVNLLAGSERAVTQAVCDPKAAPGSLTALDQMERHVREFKGRALKCYTYSHGGWRLDDEQVAYPMLEEAQRLGLRLVNTHKGLPAIFAPGSPESVRVTDYPKVMADFPKLKFCAYHSGFFQSAQDHPAGKDGITETIEVIGAMPKKLRRRFYAEVGSTFAIVFLRGPDQAAHYIGQLLKLLGPNNIIWGTDSIWWGSPQWLIDAFKNLTIPESMQQQFGYPPLTDAVKQRILGLNAAKLYRVNPKAARCTVPVDRIQAMQVAQGGAREGRSLRVYGPQTRRDFLRVFGPNGALG